MKSNTFILIVATFFIATQCTMAQVSVADLNQLYKNGEYKKAITYIKQFDNTTNSSALIVLGDCCWNESYKEEKQANDLYYQSQMMQIMASSQGLSYDNLFALRLFQQAQQEILQLRLQTIDLYSRAARLGNENGTRKLAYINSIMGYSSAVSNTSNYGGAPSNMQPQAGRTQQKCGYCNGTGWVDGTVATYGQGGTKWCSTCKREVPASHCCQCNRCPSCGGKGYR